MRREHITVAAMLSILVPIVLTSVLHAFLFHPSRIEAPAVAQLGQRVRYQSQDGVRIASWWIPARTERRRTVVYFHGNAATASDCFGWAEALAGQGSDVLLAEYRGYGQSEGTPSARGVEHDGDAALRYLIEDRGIDPRQIVVHGQSLGGAVAMHVLAGTARDVAGGVIESTFTSLHDMSRAMVRVPLSMIVPDAWALDSASRAPRISTPVLQLHGDRDGVIPIAVGRALHARFAPEVARFITVPGGEHNLMGEVRWRAILDFLRERVP